MKTDLQWEFTYDVDGTRVQQLVAAFDPETKAITSAATTSCFMGRLYEETDGVAREYYAIAGMAVAMNDGEGMQFLLTDHLGSVAAITDDEGTLPDQQRYLPFGGLRENVGSITQTDFGYTGQGNIASMGLMDNKARMYDPYLNPWTQPESIVGHPSNPQHSNRLAYVLNRPIVLTDPSGRQPACGLF